MSPIVRALVKKDFTTHRPFLGRYPITIGLMVGVPLAVDKAEIMAPLLGFQLMMTFMMMTFYVDEQNKSYRFLLSTPATRSSVVTARYISVALFMLALLPVLLALQLGASVALPAFGIDVDVSQLRAVTVPYVIAGMLLFMSLMMPQTFRTGVMEGALGMRLLFLFVLVGFFALEWVNRKLAELLAPDTYARLVETVTSLDSWALVPVALAITSGAYIISHRISLKFFLSKEI